VSQFGAQNLGCVQHCGALSYRSLILPTIFSLCNTTSVLKYKLFLESYLETEVIYFSM
jgi:hypothetical protein